MMNVRPLSRSEVRSIDETAIHEFGMPGICLMENAGRGAAAIIHGLAQTPVQILCGHGNNGGDGFVIARHLDLLGHQVQVLLLAKPERLAGDAAINWAIIQKGDMDVRVVEKDDQLESLIRSDCCIVDAMLGTGATRPPAGLFAAAIRQANRANSLRVAIDISTGLDCDTGTPAEICFLADHTCTFVAPKLAFANPAARKHTGTVHVVDIGAPASILRPFVQ